MGTSKRTFKNVFAVANSAKDRNLFMGSLVYRTGLDLSMIDDLSKADQTGYADIVPFLHGEGCEAMFHTPNHVCIFVDDSSAAHTIICVVKAGASGRDIAAIVSASEIRAAIWNGADLVVAIDGMDEVSWNCLLYEDIKASTEDVLKEVYGDHKTALFVPISSVLGANVLETPPNSLCTSLEDPKMTIVEAIDR